jgi:hypothetical protein
VRQAREQAFGTGTVLHVGRGDHHGQQQPERIDENMALATLDLLVRIVAVDPPFSVVLTDWRSILPALGWRCRPMATRIAPRSMSWLCCHVPSRRHSQQYW